MDPSLRQQDFIYDFKWGAKIDSFFIDYLCFEARVANFVWPHKIYQSLWQAIDMVNHQYNQNFSYTDGLKKLELLEQRFKTFSWMLSLEKVAHDPESNFVYAPEDVWKVILKKHRFAYAYLAEGEAKYEELSVIFAPAIDEVIIVSSDDKVVEEVRKPAVENELLVNEDGNPVLGNEFVLVNEDVNPVLENEFVLVNEDVGNDQGLVEADAEWEEVQIVDEPMALVPIQSHVHAVPLQMIPPLDMVKISSQSTQTSTFWWEHFSFALDDEGSTANSFNYTPKGIRGRSRYKNHHSPIKNARLSSTASNSPCAKPPRRFL